MFSPNIFEIFQKFNSQIYGGGGVGGPHRDPPGFHPRCGQKKWRHQIPSLLLNKFCVCLYQDYLCFDFIFQSEPRDSSLQ